MGKKEYRNIQRLICANIAQNHLIFASSSRAKKYLNSPLFLIALLTSEWNKTRIIAKANLRKR